MVALAPRPALAQNPVVYTDSERALFTLEVRDFWSLRTDGLGDLAGPEADDIRDASRVFGLTPDAHPGIWVGLISPHGVPTLRGAAEYLRDIGPFLVQDVTVSEPERRQISGMSAQRLTGQGRQT